MNDTTDTSVWDLSIQGPLVIPVILIFGFLTMGLPVLIMANRVGSSRWWALAASVPVIQIAVLYVFALKSWPRLESAVPAPEVFE